jgi:DNA-binding NarL/FixJ family response regulator
VADDGKGFDPQASVPLRATGLSGARERAERIHAALVITSAPGEGTVVSIELPLADAGSHETPVRILLVEDHATVRDAIAGMLAREDDFTIVGQAGSLAEARGMLEGVDVALIDLGLPDGSGDDLVRELREASPGADALVLTAGFDRGKIARAVANGAAGVLNKVAHLDDVVDAIRRLRAEETLLARDELAELISYDRSRRNRERADRQATERLTPRELEVLQALADGLGSEAIASRLHVTPRTERNHVANILAKLDVHTRLQAVVLGVRYGVVEIR